jgi:outer membrane protein assembly factor BamB
MSFPRTINVDKREHDSLKVGKLKTKNKKTALLISLVLVLAISFVTGSISLANAQIPTRKTAAYLSVNPYLIGLNQPLTVNLWIYPAPSTRGFSWSNQSYGNITVTFTKPDGTVQSFMPVDGSGGLAPGETELVGAIWFMFTPDKVGTWSVKFSFPGKTIGYGNESVYYAPAESKVTTFTVQSTPVAIGFPAVELPNGYWTRPINSDNREWSQISGDWLQSGYDYTASYFNPYSKAVNSPHIVWKQQVALGGIVGGAWGGISYGGSGGSPGLIVMGQLFYNVGTNFKCVDLRTGEVVYTAAGSISRAEIVRPSNLQAGTEQTQGTTPTPYLWGSSGTTWTRYDAFTGSLLQTITGVPTATGPGGTTGVTGTVSVTWVDQFDVYIVRQSGWNSTIPNRLAVNELIKWDYSKVTGNVWSTGIVYNVTLPQDAPGNGGRPSAVWVYGDVGIVNCPGENQFFAYNLVTGNLLYKKTFDFINMGRIYGPDTYLAFDAVTSKYHCYEVKTGNERWVSEVVGEYPWGVNNYPRTVVYNKLFVGAYDGYLYAINMDTGKIEWKFSSGTTTETVFGAWAFYTGGPAADGKYYMATSEHTPTQPRTRGNKLYCIDANTGAGVWNISGAISAQAIAEGYLVGVSENDGVQYCFGKGQTATAVDVSGKVVAKGSSVLIEGTVTDQSPAQEGTPAISDKDMGSWMDYLHMQKPMPSTATGVTVHLEAELSNGTIIDITHVASDILGHFEFAWTPPTQDTYKIIATFEGSESYYGSSDECGLSVGSAAASVNVPSANDIANQVVSQLPTDQPTTPAPTLNADEIAQKVVNQLPSTPAVTNTDIAIIVVVVLAVIIGIANLVLLLRRKPS